MSSDSLYCVLDAFAHRQEEKFGHKKYDKSSQISRFSITAENTETFK